MYIRVRRYFHLTYLDRLMVKEVDGVKMSKFGHLFGKEKEIKMPLQPWGEGGVIKVTGKVKRKLKLRGEVAMFVGYARDSATNTYRMYVPETNSIHETRGAQWAKRMYYVLKKS